MRISLTTSGGWGAALHIGRPPQVLDSTQLSDAESDRLAELIAAARAEKSRSPSTERLPDVTSYRLDIHDEAGQTQLRATDANMTEGFAELLAYTKERMKPDG